MTNSSFYFTKTGIIIPTVTGTISFLSSSTIIYIIARSKSGIKTAYHRIILGLSIADCLTSLAVALTTIPMPKDVIYPFALASYGNVATCEAQGLIYIVGNVACFSMNGILNIYYLCSLRFNMKEHTFRNYLEIPLYILMLALSIGVSCGAFLNQEIINPSPTDPFCVPNSYPVDCTKEDNPDCRGGGGRGAFTPGYLATLSIGTSTLLVTMTLIIHSFYRNERKLRKSVKDKQIKEDDEELQALLFAQKTYGIITRQALLYIAAFVITWIFGFFEYLLIDRGLRILSILRILLQPLQGLFNLMIFVYHKAFMLLRNDEDMNLAEAMNEIFLKPGKMEDSVQIHNLDVVLEDHFSYGVNYVGNAQGSTVGNGSEDVNVHTDNGMKFNSGNASTERGSSIFAHNGALPSIDEEKVQTRKYYVGDQAAAPTILKGNAAPFTDISLAPESSIKENNDGVSFSWDHARSPSQASNERNNSLEVFSEDDLSYHFGSRSKSMLSGFSSIFSSKSPD
mmetsp:Transcript_18052/g.26815  ORF Transcript_18052/g.26815 Transcript_18052/m.26815 type:complete len:510 (-) Transcript_18052:272-1801(-)